jgi:hypothetical protein
MTGGAASAETVKKKSCEFDVAFYDPILWNGGHPAPDDRNEEEAFQEVHLPQRQFEATHNRKRASASILAKDLVGQRSRGFQSSGHHLTASEWRTFNRGQHGIEDRETAECFPPAHAVNRGL